MKKSCLIIGGLSVFGICLVGCGVAEAPHEHVWQYAYTWSEDFSTCTAKRFCLEDSSHYESETVNSTSEVMLANSCTTRGTVRYKATFANEYFDEQFCIDVLPATGHNWGEPTYTWSSDYSTCTAERVCLNDGSHIEVETAESTYFDLVPAGCETQGIGRHEAHFDNSAFLTQYNDQPIEASGHDYRFITFVWDGFEAEAMYICAHDSSHVQYYEAKVTSKVTIEVSCESDGVRVYTASYDGHEDYRTEIIPSLGGHIWGEPTYTWSDDHSTCTAERVCLNDSSHVDSETVSSSYSVITKPTGEEEGLGIYTATFENEAFSLQTLSVSIEKLDYSYGKTPSKNSNGVFEYGLYPQSRVKDSDLLASLNALTTTESNGWYLYDGDYYANTSASPAGSGYTFKDGATVVQGQKYWFKCEPIQWKSMRSLYASNRYCLLAQSILDCTIFNSSVEKHDDGYDANNWDRSDIKEWLNSDFYNSAFALNDSYNKGNPFTSDKVFFPNNSEYMTREYGFTEDALATLGVSRTGINRHTKTTDWALARGATCEKTGSNKFYGPYWTRSERWSDSVFLVKYDGSLQSQELRVDFACGIRPAIAIEMP